jgi:hypothetical protein
VSLGRLVALSLLAACAPDPGPPRGPGSVGEDQVGDTDPADTPADTGTAAVRVRVFPRGVRRCANPTRRADARFDLLELPAEPDDGARRLVGGGAVIADLDGDGALDVFLPGRLRTDLVEHGRGGTIVATADRRLAPGIDLSQATGATAADVDGDGDLDLLVTRWERPVVLLVQERGVFVDGTAASGLQGSATWQASAWGDLDADGDLDLFLGAYGPHPDDVFATEDFTVGDPSALWENRGDGTFVDRSDLLSAETQASYTFGAAWQDLDGDLRPELIVVNDFGWARPGTVYWNRPGGLVEDDGGSGLRQAFAGMGLGLGDVDGDGSVDLVQSSWKDLSLLLGDGDGGWYEGAPARALAPVYAWSPEGEEPPPGWRNPNQVFGWGTELVDLDVDGDLDLVVNFGAWDEYPEPARQRDAVFEQDADGTFHDRGAAWGYADAGAARGLAVGDLNDDGWPDLVERVLGAPTRVLLSRCGEAGWLRVRLLAPPPNTRAIGARVRVTSGARSWERWVRAGGTGMYGASAPDALFGLGDVDVVDHVEIAWPDGAVTRLDEVATRQIVDVLSLP